MTCVLLVEDDLAYAAVLSALFEEAGLAVEHCRDAESAHARLRTAPFDVVISDLALPGESGFDLCQRIKQDDGLATRIPVIVLTSQADPLNVLRGLEAGADGFITKDHPPEEIVRRVRRTLAIDAAADGVAFQGQRFQLRVGSAQLLNVLLSAFEDGVELNRRLAQSEAALREANLDLLKANAALEEANRVKDKFLGIAAHDLRNPLAAIQGFVSLLSDGTLGEVNQEQTDALNRIRKSANTMLTLLSELLDVSALRAGKMTFRIERQSPGPTLRDAFDSVTLPALQKEIEIVWQVAEELPEADFDRHRLLEVVSNLLSNAVKYCPRSAKVTLGARQDGERLEIFVSDTGPGIRPEEIGHLFEPFGKLSARPTAGEKSTGLGLSIAKEIVEQHAGQIWAESDLGRGATFRIALPLRSASGHAA